MNEATCRKIVLTRAGLGDPLMARCEKCGAPPPLTMHHRHKRSHGGEWTPSNIVALCGDGTTGDHGWVEGNPTEAHAQGWALRDNDVATVVPILHHALGMRVRLDDEGCLEIVA